MWGPFSHGIENIINAFSSVIKKILNARLLLVGDGAIKKDLKIQVERLGIDKSVIFTGYIKHDLIPEILAITDIAVAPVRPSPVEFYNSPIKLFEYMAAGKSPSLPHGLDRLGKSWKMKKQAYWWILVIYKDWLIQL